MTTARQILACFTMAKRLHLELTQAALAQKLGIRPDQISRAENGRPCGRDAAQVLAQWNGIAHDEAGG